jgi:hypothetical protein
MSHTYLVNKSNLPNGVADMLGLRAQVEADLSIPPKQDADPQFIDADNIEFSFAGPLDEDAGEVDNLVAVVAAHDGTGPAVGRPRLDDGTPVMSPRATYVDGLMFVQRSLMCTVTPPGPGEGSTVTIADHAITTEIRLSGGEYQIDGDGIVPGDRVTFAIVDKLGLIYAMTGGAMGLPAEGEPGGGVYYVHKFVDNVHLVGSYHGAVQVEGEGMNTISQGLFLRMLIDSNTERTTPANHVANVIGRFKVYE